MSNPQYSSLSISLPDAFPWGVALVSIESGAVLYANKHMELHYLGEARAEGCIDEKFVFPGGLTFEGIVATIFTGSSWTGRAVPQHNQYGLNSVELMIHLDPDDTSRVWIYTLENPSVDGMLRFSSRSEIQLLRVLLDNTLEYVFFRDQNGRFILTNKAFDSAVSKGEVASVVGQTLDRFVSEESAAWVREIDGRIYASGLPSVNKVSHFVFNNGTEHWLQMTTVPVRSDSGQIVGSVSVARDINDLKRTESELRVAIKQAKAASRAKGEFLAAMSHEIRTPINGIVGGSELCQETQLDAEQRGYLDTVVQCSNTLLSLVNEVLDFSKIEAGQLNLERLSFNPEVLLEEVGTEFAQLARKKGLELMVAYDEELPCYIMGDPTRLKQIIYNLVGNAVKFTEVGEIILKAETLERDDQHAKIRFSVTDTGIGITPSRRDAIFKSFTQEDMSTTRKYGGTGLGLSICKELTALMGGDIRAENGVERGSRFIVEIPFELSVNPGIEAIPFNPELAGLHVLIVDDNETNRGIYQQMCRLWGYRASIACDGVEGLSMLEQAAEMQDPYRLVLLDQQMPGLTGLDLASLIINRPELKDLRMLLLSSSLNHSESERAQQLGVARALSKPVKRQTLLEVILETFGINGAGGSGEGPEGVAEQVPEAEIAALHILLVEDNVINQQIAKRRLEKLGHSTVIVSNGLEAVEAVQSEGFDCVLMDVQMPEMDGYAATREIRRIEAAEGLVPNFVIAMTAHAMKGDEEKCREAGMDEYIAKPFRVDRLREVLRLASKAAVANAAALFDGEAGGSRAQTFSQRLDAMGEEDREDVMSVAGLFSNSVLKDISKLKLALEEADFAQIGFVAHATRGGAGVFADPELVELGARIEVACSVRDLGKARQLSDQFINALRALKEEVDVELKQRPASSSAH